MTNDLTEHLDALHQTIMDIETERDLVTEPFNIRLRELRAEEAKVRVSIFKAKHSVDVGSVVTHRKYGVCRIAAIEASGSFIEVVLNPKKKNGEFGAARRVVLEFQFEREVTP